VKPLMDFKDPVETLLNPFETVTDFLMKPY
jgi:hypothetical protein